VGPFNTLLIKIMKKYFFYRFFVDSQSTVLHTQNVKRDATTTRGNQMKSMTAPTTLEQLLSSSHEVVILPPKIAGGDVKVMDVEHYISVMWSREEMLVRGISALPILVQQVGNGDLMYTETGRQLVVE
jgi:hypothetical protein